MLHTARSFVRSTLVITSGLIVAIGVIIFAVAACVAAITIVERYIDARDPCVCEDMTEGGEDEIRGGGTEGSLPVAGPDGVDVLPRPKRGPFSRPAKSKGPRRKKAKSRWDEKGRP